MEWKPDVVNKTFFIRLKYLVHQREWRPVDTGEGLSGDTPSFFHEKLVKNFDVSEKNIIFVLQ